MKTLSPTILATVFFFYCASFASGDIDTDVYDARKFSRNASVTFDAVRPPLVTDFDNVTAYLRPDCLYAVMVYGTLSGGVQKGNVKLSLDRFTFRKYRANEPAFDFTTLVTEVPARVSVAVNSSLPFSSVMAIRKLR